MLKLIIFLNLAVFSRCAVVTLGRRTGHGSATNVDLDLSGCTPTLEETLDRNIQSINTHNACVQLYKEQYCTGQYLIVRPGSIYHDNLHYYGFADNVRSIGPCFEKCHPDRQHTSTAWATVEFNGATVAVQPNKCRDITSEIRNIGYAPFRPTVKTSSCIEVHEFADCTGNSTQLTVGHHTTAESVSFWGNKEQAGSLSFCGYNCNRTYALEELDKEDIEPEEGSITLFRHIDFAGERTNLALKGCTLLPLGWNGNVNSSTAPPRSMITYGQCVMLYEDEKCESDPPLLEAVMGAEPILFWGNRTLKAMQFCPMNMFDEHELHEHLQEHYCGSGGKGGWVVITMLIICIVVIVVEALIIYKMRDESLGRGGRIRFGGGHQQNGHNGMQRHDIVFVEGNNGTSSRNGTSTGMVSSRLPYNPKMETPLIEINE